MKINAEKLTYRELNQRIRVATESDVVVENVCGQRYIGCGLSGERSIVIHGVPGNDLAAFMNGPEIVVHGNAQDCVGNTMNNGQVVVHGDAGDVLGYSMRGGKIFVRGNAGYRVGIHMKHYQDKIPLVVIGGCVQDYLGEYMAGGLIVVLGLDSPNGSVGEYVGTGMHAGKMLLRGDIKPYQLGKEVGIAELNENDAAQLRHCVEQYCHLFGLREDSPLKERFVKLIPVSHRPYGKIYVY